LTLTEIEDNPAPDGAQAIAVTTPDRVRLRSLIAPPSGQGPGGTVCLFQGRAEYLEKYFETARNLAARGFHVAALDWRGQGGSDRPLRNPRKGHVSTFGRYERDLAAFLDGVVRPNCPPPYYAFAHSTGGLVLLGALSRGERGFSRVFLSGPFLGLGTIYEPVGPARFGANLLNALGFGRAFVPGGGSTPVDWQPFDGNPLTSDQRRFARNARVIEVNPALSLGGPTIGWVAAALRAIAQVTAPGVAERIEVPVLMIAAGADRIVSLPTIDAIGRRLKRGRTITLQGARHEVLQERDLFREQVLAAFDAFVPGSDRA
jgi:lysophospholipase